MATSLASQKAWGSDMQADLFSGSERQEPSLLSLMLEPAIIRPVEPNGEVIPAAAIAEVIDHKGQGFSAQIQLHPTTGGMWMWSTGYSTPKGGACYQVGPKWGRFARTRQGALEHACEELRAKTANCMSQSTHAALCAWMGGLS